MIADRTAQLQARLDEAGIRFFGAGELGRQLNRTWPGPRFVIPTVDEHEHIIETLRLADRIREEHDGPVIVVSGFRSPAYNRHVKGSPTSRHMTFHALDLRPADGDYVRFARLAWRLVQAWRATGHKVGIGFYPDANTPFVHVDVDGRTANWTGGKAP